MQYHPYLTQEMAAEHRNDLVREAIRHRQVNRLRPERRSRTMAVVRRLKVLSPAALTRPATTRAATS